MPNPSRWSRTLSHALLLSAATWTAGCRGDTDRPGESGDGADRGGTAVLAELNDMSKPLPLIGETQLDLELVDIMFMGLTRGAWRGGELAHLTAEESPMALARSYELLGPDSANLRYHMRSDVRWSDGTPLTAHDVVWTYQMVGDTAVNSPRRDQVEQMDSVVAQNDSTVTFYFGRRYPEMVFHSSLPVAPRHIFAGSAPGEIRMHPAVLDPAGKMVVSGAFQLSGWQQGDRIILTRNPNFQPQPRLDQIVIRIIPESTTRLVELETGGVDFTRPVPHDQIPGLRARAPHLRFEREEKRFYDYIAYNPTGFAPFADPEIRRALGLAVDVPEILRGLQMEDLAIPAGGPYPPILEGVYDPEEQGALPYDSARAREILASKGWRDTDDDGILERNGVPFRFTLILNTGNPRKADAAQIIQQQWRRIGVDARIQLMEFNTFWDRQMNKTFQAAFGNWGVGLSPDLSEVWGPDTPLNFVSFNDPEVTALMQRAQTQPTEALANLLWKQAAQRIVDAQPYTWLYYFDQVDGVNQRLRGMKIDTFGAYQNPWEWWIPTAEQTVNSAPMKDSATGSADTTTTP